MAGINWEEFRLEIDGFHAIEPCFEFVLYLETSRDDGLLEFYERARAALGPLITHYQTDGMRRPRKLDERADTIVPTWVKRPRPGKIYWIDFSGCGDDEGVTPASLELSFFHRRPDYLSPEVVAERKAILQRRLEQGGVVLSPAAMVLRVTFPVEAEIADPAAALNWILDLKLVGSHPFLSGHAGYALNYYIGATDPVRVPMEKTLCSLLLRYPGLDYHSLGGVSNHMFRYDADKADFVPLIKRVSWLNLVSDGTIEHLGGHDALVQGLGTDLPISVHELQYGLAIQAGVEPQLGDVAGRDFIPEYRRVAKTLRPVRLEAFPGEGRYFSHEDAEEWLNAFDKEYD